MQPDEFVTADTHFGHSGIVRLAERPFEDRDEMDRELIRLWNAKVPKSAVVYHLGDFALTNRHKALAILGQLHGRIRLILGNHDQVIKGEVADRFEWIKSYYESKTEDGTKVAMFHYPILAWNKAHYGSWQLHGHCHASLPDAGVRRLDIGVDAHPNYEPFSYHEIFALMQERQYQAADHHKGHDE